MPLKLGLTFERRMVMTTSLRQSLDILQMPQMELATWLLSEIEKNPLLEPVGPPFNPLVVEQKELESKESLYDHLKSQIREAFPEGKLREKAEELLHTLDEKGYLESPLPEGAEKVLPILQTFDPPGIFATSLQECLLLQLKAKNLVDSPVFRLVKDFFSDLLEGRYAQIKKKIDLTDAIQKLSQLQLRPVSSFQSECAPSLIADLRILHIEGKWIIEIPDRAFPQFQIIRYELENFSKEEKKCVREWTYQAKWISHCVKRRQQLLLKIGAYLVRKQSGYLHRQENLKPLSMKEAAKDLEMHESTLSRALSGKYAETPRGLILLRSLIHAAPQALSAKEWIKQLCEKEKTPLTDSEISELLAKQGISIARRTIAKYRKSLKIGSARNRPYSSPKAFPKSQPESPLDVKEHSLG